MSSLAKNIHDFYEKSTQAQYQSLKDDIKTYLLTIDRRIKSRNIIIVMSSPSRESQMPPLASPTRRKRLLTEDNIRISDRFSASNLKKARINTLQNEQEYLQRQPSIRKINSSKLNLSPIKYYQTKLNLSCQAWSAFSISEKIYKRGWRPNKPAQFNGLARLVIAMIYLDTVQECPETGKVTVRTNRYLLGQQKESRKSVKDLQKARLDKEINVFAENTLISLSDLVAAMLINSSSQILSYTAVFVGYIVSNLQNDRQFFKELSGPIIINSYFQGFQLIGCLADQANTVLRQRFPETSITNTMEFITTPNELSQLFADVINKHKSLLNMIEAKEVVSAIRYQVGFKFYEDRTIRFLSQRIHPLNHIVLSCRGKNNFGVISYNKITSMVLVLHDCKFSMADIDINRIQEWLKSISKPSEARQKQSKLLPLLKLIQ